MSQNKLSYNPHNNNFKKNYYHQEDSEDSFHPWIKPNSKCLITNGMLKLHYEILDFCDFIKLTSEEIDLREKTFNYIKSIIEAKFEEYKCILYGSFKTQLSLPDSDIDILIVEKNNNIDNNNLNIVNSLSSTKIKEEEKLSDIIQKIYNILFDTKKFSYIEMIKAKVPIIKCTLKETEVNIDISFFRKNGSDAVETIEKIVEIFPEIRPLTLVIKYTLRQRQLNEIYKGGISSFIIFSLIYYYMSDVRKKILDDIQKGKKEGELTLGHLLVGFFNFYGFMFNYDKLGISIRSGCFLYKRKEHKPNTLSIENFQDINQDMGKNCYNFKRVVETFKNARDSLYYPERSPVISYLAGFILPDDILKQRAEKFNNYNYFD